jgi:signal transduction histidine kinase
VFDLRTVPLFAELPDGDLEKLTAGLTRMTLAAGDELFAEGDHGGSAYVITSGEVEVVKVSGETDVRVAVVGVGEVIGEMALLDEAPRMASVRALSDVSLVAIPKANLDALLASSAAAVKALFAVFTKRWRETQSRLRQSERMAQLGVLTAGLAHEMNNPAAAVQRGASQLQGALDRYGEASRALGPDTMIPEDVNLDIRDGPVLSSLERADRETEVEELLESHGIEQPWELAPSLVAAGIDRDRLIALHSSVGDTLIVDAIRALAAEADVRGLLAEVEEGARRLAELVTALKSYSFLDQAPVQDVDIVRGIEDTLLILKSKTSGIEIVREYDDDLSPMTAFGSQLNQVWTNLIDNAADAITASGSATGVIVLRARSEGEHVIVEVEDNGPGIAPEDHDRVFEAFYTTKPPGQGTGLGLDTVYAIVVHQHRGTVTVDSEPGRTTFTVTLPTDLDDADG